MNINMKDINLIKPTGQNWIYISEDGTTVDTKLLYDDPADSVTLENYQAQIIKFGTMQELERAADFLDGVDFLYTGGKAKVGAEQTKEISSDMYNLNLIKNIFHSLP